MKRDFLFLTIALMVATSAVAQEEEPIANLNIDEVVVSTTRATTKTPVAFTNISGEQLNKQNQGQDLPYLLSITPSAITTSDAGAGIGYTTLRVRGTDGTRINVTANGIPINDAESHNVFWVNMPDFASSVKDVQVQRGAGTSTNGAGAFGASINMQTGGFGAEQNATFDAAYGAFNTRKQTLTVGTGLINNHWEFGARLSNIGTDGFIDRAEAKLNSFYAQAAFYANNTSIKLISFGGKERTYHAWNYASKEEMEKYGRSYNSCGYMFTDDNGVDHYYKDQTDNYIQTHYQLLVNHSFNAKLTANLGLHYTKGDGYYQEYKTRRTLSEYGLNSTAGTKSDLVRKKAMTNDFAGFVFGVSYKTERLSATLGGGFNQYDGEHFGKVLWVKNFVGDINPDNDYYRNHSVKNDGNIYAKADFDIVSNLSAYVDLQLRHIGYTIDGVNDNYNWIDGEMQRLNIDESFDFFNPKAGLNWNIAEGQRAYASVSMAHKEPTRNNYTDGKFFERPKSEQLIDYELGYSYAAKKWSVGANFYYMDYKDQLVLTGELNEIGEAMSANVPESYRMGIELVAGVTPFKGFDWNVNATISKNRIKNFTEVLYEDTDYSEIRNYLGTTPIAFSPDFIFNNIFAYKVAGFEAQLHSQFVSEQYMSNSKQADCMLDAYFVSNLRLSYSIDLPTVKKLIFGCTIYNLFNEEYENNGYAGSGYYEGERYNYSGYAAQAGINVMGNITLKF